MEVKNKELTIDKEFRELIAPLSDDEFKQLKENILSDGCREPIVTWNGIIVDGHNRYEICTEGNISFQTVSMNFADRSEAMMWMLKNQLGRRNLNDFQRNEIALKYEQVIAEQMRERQATSTGGKNPQLKTKWSEAENRPEPSTRRKELAKIAGTSEGSIQRSKLILEQGTPEQISRARQGGTGNNIASIANEIKKQEKAKSDSEKQSEIKSRIRNMTKKDVVGDLYDQQKVVEVSIDKVIVEFEASFKNYIYALSRIIAGNSEAFADGESKHKMADVIDKAAKQVEALKGEL